MGRASRRKDNAKSFGQLYGVELFEDSRLLRFILFPLHFDVVDERDPPFPLADVNDRTKTNANFAMYLVRQHPDDPAAILVVHHRYFHRDSQDPSDGLDLKRTTFYTVPEDAINGVVPTLCRFTASNDALPLCAPPVIHDFSALPIKAAVDALTTLPCVHSRVTVLSADGGVQ